MSTGTALYSALSNMKASAKKIEDLVVSLNSAIKIAKNKQENVKTVSRT